MEEQKPGPENSPSATPSATPQGASSTPAATPADAVANAGNAEKPTPDGQKPDSPSAHSAKGLFSCILVISTFDDIHLGSP